MSHEMFLMMVHNYPCTTWFIIFWAGIVVMFSVWVWGVTLTSLVTVIVKRKDISDDNRRIHGTGEKED